MPTGAFASTSSRCSGSSASPPPCSRSPATSAGPTTGTTDGAGAGAPGGRGRGDRVARAHARPHDHARRRPAGARDRAQPGAAPGGGGGRGHGLLLPVRGLQPGRRGRGARGGLRLRVRLPDSGARRALSAATNVRRGARRLAAPGREARRAPPRSATPLPVRVRIMHVITGLVPGGAENQLRLLLRHTRHEAVVVTLTNPGSVAAAIRSEGTPVVHLGMRSNRDLTAIMRLRGLMRESAWDVVHTHLYRACLYGRTAARLAGIPRVVTTEHSL